MKATCPRCGGTVAGARGQTPDIFLPLHFARACPAPKPKENAA